MSVSVDLSIRLSAGISEEREAQTSPSLLRILPEAVARSFSSGDAIRYILPVLWMMSCLPTIRQAIATLRAPARGGSLIEIRETAPGAESAVSTIALFFPSGVAS